MHDAESNELRCTAHQIIFDLHKSGELSQIQLLHMAASLAYKSLDPAKFQAAVKAQTLTATQTNLFPDYSQALLNEYMSRINADYFASILPQKAHTLSVVVTLRRRCARDKAIEIGWNLRTYLEDVMSFTDPEIEIRFRPLLGEKITEIMD